jgi:membrane associated rhomboid family serine protease
VEQGQSPDDFCYRHPKRVSYVLCQRCARTICGDCQIPAAVGVHCPECDQEAKRNRPRVKTRRTGEKTPVTFGLLALMGVVYLGQLFTGGLLTDLLLYWPPLTISEPWRMVTSLFVHSETSFFHILFNGYSLWVLGTLLERLLGRVRFLMLFLISGLGGSLAVLWLAPGSAVVGASGAIFGLFGALLVVQRSFGVTNPQLVIVLVINLVMGFVVPGISWQAHIGGLLTGLAIAWGLVKSRESAKTLGSIGIFLAVFGLIAVLTLTRFILA